MHDCPRCGRPTEGAYSEGGLKWDICEDCMSNDMRRVEECRRIAQIDVVLHDSMVEKLRERFMRQQGEEQNMTKETETHSVRGVRFYCERCGTEVWDFVDWHRSYLRNYTLKQLMIQLVCSDCLLTEIREDREKEQV